MKNKIYIKLWLGLKPYNKPTVTDSYYLKLSNEIKDYFIRDYSFSLLFLRFLKPEHIDLLACFLTSWFEDVVSGVGIWKAFTGRHKQHYGKVLPFYSTDDYFEGEINEQDIAFLTWYFLNTMQEEKFVSPYNDFITDTASEVMEILEEKYEYAPENNHLKSFYRLDENETDFYAARNLIDILLFKTWLFYPDTLQELLESEKEIIEESDDDRNLLSFLNENRDRLIHSARTHLMSLKGKEWAAKVVGDDHPLSKAFENMSQRVQGYFLYKGQNDGVIFLEHIASGKKFEMTQKSFDYSHELTKADTIVFIGLVQWMDEWWFSGVYVQQPFDANLVLDERNSMESRMQMNILTDKSPETKDYLQKQYETFLRYTNGSPIAFLPSSEIQGFLDRWTEFFNDSLKLADKDHDEARERARKEGFFRTKEEDKEDFAEDGGSGLVFIDPDSGIFIGMNVNNAFPLPNNPYYNESGSEEDAIHVLMSDEIPAGLAHYCIEQGKDKLPFFTEGAGASYLRDTDFLLRFWKGENYHPRPQVTPIGAAGSDAPIK